MRSAAASGAKTTLIATFQGFQFLGMTGANGGKSLLGGDCALGVGFHGVVNRTDLRSQPVLDGGVALLESPQPCPNDLARRRIGSGTDFGIDELCLPGRQTEGAFLH